MGLDVFLMISLGLVFYILLLFILKKMNVWRKTQCSNCNNCCPDCQEPLERIRRKRIDYFINYLTFQIFDFKKYKCLHCAWEGRRWSPPFSGKFQLQNLFKIIAAEADIFNDSASPILFIVILSGIIFFISLEIPLDSLPKTNKEFSFTFI